MGAIVPGPSEHNDGHDMVASRLIVFEILSVVLQLLSIAFNGAIICTLCKRSLLKYPSNRFVFSLCLSHLVVSFLSVVISILSAFLSSSPPLTYKGSHYVSEESLRNYASTSNVPTYLLAAGTDGMSAPVQCSTNGVDLVHLIMMHFNFGVAVCTSITVALISAERYITIARPMRYKSIVTARRSLYAIILCWLLAALITMMPLLLFENRHPVCGTFSVPMESLATYFGVVFAVVTLFALAVMIVCYTHIFRIAKAKCQKVQIGHFTASTVSSISSDWPSSAYSSAQGQNRYLHAGSRIESSNSLLHWVLMTNLGRHTQPLRVPNALRGGVPLTPPATPTLPPKTAFFSESALNSRRESDETTTTGTSGGSSRNGSTSSSNSGRGGPPNSSNYLIDSSRFPLFQYHHAHRKLRNRWKTYLQPNYNSPRKTIFTIVLLIGAVLFTQLPLSFVLFTTTVQATQSWFQFCTTVLFSTSSVANPVLYGFLNRSIRDQLWRLLKRKSRAGDHGPSASSIRKRKRGQQQQLEEIAQNSKGFLSPANHSHLQNLCRGERAIGGGRVMEIPAIKISRKESISSDDNSSVHSINSSHSIHIVGTNTSIPTRGGSGSGAKGRISQVQKRITSSPYYRTVLLKKANGISRSNSLLPRLALPDVNVRRNSSGSIVSVSANGTMSKMKGKVKEMDEEWTGPSGNRKYEDESKNADRDGQQMVEMQTFRNYSTPDLPLSLSSTNNLKSERVPAGNSNSEENSHRSDGGKDLVTDDIEMNRENKTEGQVQLPRHNAEGLGEDTTKEPEGRRDSDANNVIINGLNASNEPSPPTVSSHQSDSQPGSSHAATLHEKKMDTAKIESSSGELEACLPAENLMGARAGADADDLPDNFPRKPSQDSGADMSFSDDEEEIPPPPPPQPIPGLSEHVLHHHCHHHHFHQQQSAVLLSSTSLSSLPGATVAMMLKTGEDTQDGNAAGDDAHSTASSTSLLGPLFSIGYPDVTTAGNDSPDEQTPTGIILLPCSCPKRNSPEGSDSDDDDNNGNRNTLVDNQQGILQNENGVTVTITDSNSDTHLFNPHLFNSNDNLLQVDSNLRHHIPANCIRKEARQHKSRSESDIATVNHGRGSEESPDLKIRSNCHINYSVLNGKSQLSGKSGYKNTSKNPAFTLISCCNKCSTSCSNETRNLERGISPSCCSFWISSNGQSVVPLTNNSRSLEQVHPYLLKADNSNYNTTSLVNLASPQWLSVMSVHSSCSSLSSTCPLRILDGHNKSDISDYDDFEDHIEI